MKKKVSESCWSVLGLSSGASIEEIHKAYETLRMAILPSNRDRSVPLSSKVQEQLNAIDRAFQQAINPKKFNDAELQDSVDLDFSLATPKKGSHDPFKSIVNQVSIAASKQPAQHKQPINSQRVTSHTTIVQKETSLPSSSPEIIQTNLKDTKKGSGSFYKYLIPIVVFVIVGIIKSNPTPPSNSASTVNNVTNSSTQRIANPRVESGNVQASSNASGASEQLIMSIQRELNKKGFNAGVPDGRLTRDTREAISSAQSAYDMKIDGNPSDALLRALRRN